MSQNYRGIDPDAIEKTIVTFDFDDTLTRPNWNPKYQLFEPSDRPNHETFDRLREFHDRGYEIRIVTARFRPQEVWDFVKEHHLPISEVHCTEGELKGKTLLEIGSELHFDDWEEELLYNRLLSIPTILVCYRFDSSQNRDICEFEEFR